MDDVSVAKVFISATIKVLSTMAGITPVAGMPFVKADVAALGDVSAIVGIVGAKRGSIAVTFPRSTAMAVMKGMLGDDIHDVLQDAKDAVGEVANMISGQARAMLAERGMTMQGSTPTVILGDKHSITHFTHAPVLVIPFSSQAGDMVVEFCLE